MNVIIQYSNSLAQGKYKQAVWRLLTETDKEFIPPLSFREGTTQQNLGGKAPDIPISLFPYFTEIQNQHFIFAINNEDEILGFMSFKHPYINHNIEEYCPCNYISTLCVSKKFRGNGIAGLMYRYIEENLPRSITSGYIATRTWTGNISHIHLLEKRGYALVKQLTNDRGKGIHTVYFVKKVSL